MKKIFLMFTAIATLFAVSCSSEYDDTAVWDELGKHNERISKLETLCGQMNTNISSLQAIVTALQSNDYVTGVAPITQNGVEVGYTITFSKSGSITIYHGKDGANGQDGKDGVDGTNGTDGKDGVNGTDGKDGQDGLTPVIGVKQDSDGVYYWTLNGEWLLDDAGNKIKAVGTDGKDGENGKDGQDGTNGADGKDGVDGTNGTDGVNGVDGITPQLKIENDYWYISYDNGTTWTQLGKAKGEDGQSITNGDSQFVKIDTSDANYVVFTLIDGTEIKLPTMELIQSQNVFSIVFDTTDFVIGAVEDMAVPFKLTGTVGTTEIDAIAMSGDDDQSARIEMLDETNGVLYISRILWGDDFNVLVIASNNGRTIHKLITIRSGELYTYDYFEISGLGGRIEIPVTTNYDYEVVVPEEYSSWISYVDIETRSELRDETIVMSVAQNVGEYDRCGEIELKDKHFGSLLARIYVYQMPVQLRLSADKTNFNADGNDFVQLEVVESGWNTITEGVEFYNAENEKIEIENFQFKTTTAGSYSIYAKYGDIVSNTIHLLAKDENTPEYISTMGETGADDILCTVLGLDGSILYYHQDESRPGVVNKISKFNNITREVEFVVNLDEDGKVTNILTPEVTIVLGNYHDNLVDAMIFTPNGERIIVKDIDYSSVATLMTRTPTGIEIANLVVSGVATGLEIAAIASVGVAAAGPVAVTTATIGAALLLYDAATAFDLIEDNIGANLATHLVGHYGNLAGLATNFPTNRLEILAALMGQASDILGLLEMFEDDSKSEIIVGNGTLEPNGCLSATLTWSGPADIDLHCVDPSGCHVYYSNKVSPIGGYLDNDNTTANGPETIYYSNPQDGSYSFYIHYYAEKNGVKSVDYTVKINRFGEIAEYSGTISGQGTQIHIETLLIGSVTNTRTLELQGNYVIDWNNLPKK